MKLPRLSLDQFYSSLTSAASWAVCIVADTVDHNRFFVQASCIIPSSPALHMVFILSEVVMFLNGSVCDHRSRL